MDIYAAIHLVTGYLSLLVFVKMAGVFYQQRRTSLKAMLLYILPVSLVLSFLHLYIRHNPAPYLTAVRLSVTLLGYFAATFNYESKLIKRLVVTVLTYTIIMFIAIVIGIPVYILFPNIVPDYNLHTNILSVINIIAGYFLASLLRRFKSIRKNSVFPRIALFVPIPMVLVIVGIFAVHVASSFGADILIEVSAIILVILIAGPIFLIFYLYDILSAKYEDKLRSELQAKEKEYYFDQCRLMQESMEKVKSIQHDMKLHLTTLRDYAADNQAATDYLNSLLDDIEDSETYSDTGNIAFDSIINFKLKNAKESNIKLDLQIAVPPTIGVEVSDIVTILGNLLDNALDAVAKVEDRFIKLDAEFGKGGLFIKVENAFDGKIKYSEDKRMITSKDEDGHGYGLKNIRQSVEKYDGYVKVTYSDIVFSVVVFLYAHGNNSQNPTSPANTRG